MNKIIILTTIIIAIYALGGFIPVIITLIGGFLSLITKFTEMKDE